MKENEFIKIDDLFKGKPDKEETIPSGAWKNMSELLDKAALTSGQASRRFGRYGLFALMTLGLGVTAVSLQQKQLNNINHTATNVSAERNAIDPQNIATSNNVQQLNIATDANENNNETSIAATNSLMASNDIAQAATANITSNNSYKKIANTKSANSQVVASQSFVASGVKEKSVKANNSPSQLSAVDNNKINKNNKKVQLKRESLSSDIEIASSIQNNQNLNTISGFAANNNELNSATEIALSTIDKNKYKPTEAKDSNYVAVVKDAPNKIKYVAVSEDEWKREIVANVNEIERTITTVKNEDGSTNIRIDTVRDVKYTKIKLNPLSPEERQKLLALTSNVSLSSSTKIGATTLKEAAEKVTLVNNVNLVPLASYKVASNNNKTGFAARLYDMMSDYFNAGNPFYFSGHLGLQSMFSNPMQTGFHAGLGAYYEAKPRLTLGVEFQYVLNSFSNSKVTETFANYTGHTVDNSGNNPVFSAIEQQYQNIYTLNKTSYFVLPITLRYQLSRFSIMTGVYGSYTTGTKYAVQENKLLGETKTVTGNKAFENSKGNINSKDFAARYGLGYSLGVGYDFNKFLSADLRLNQNLWQSGNQNSTFSKNLYQNPGIQFSLFYFIGKRDKVMYMMKSK